MALWVPGDTSGLGRWCRAEDTEALGLPTCLDRDQSHEPFRREEEEEAGSKRVVVRELGGDASALNRMASNFPSTREGRGTNLLLHHRGQCQKRNPFLRTKQGGGEQTVSKQQANCIAAEGESSLAPPPP